MARTCPLPLAAPGGDIKENQFMKAYRKALSVVLLLVLTVSLFSGCYLLDGRHYRSMYNNLGDDFETLQKDVERYFFNYDYDSPHDNY
jgi:hypothetical protein